MQTPEQHQLQKGLAALRALGPNLGRRGFEAVVPNPKLKLLDQVREVMRLRHYSIRTETSCCDWMLRSYWVAHSGILFIAGIKFENHELGIFLCVGSPLGAAILPVRITVLGKVRPGSQHYF